MRPRSGAVDGCAGARAALAADPRDPTHEVPAEDLGSHGVCREGAGGAAKRAVTPTVAWQP